MQDNYEHENWIRYHSFKQAKKITKQKDINKLIEEAAKIEAYVLNKKKCELLVYNKEIKKGS